MIDDRANTVLAIEKIEEKIAYIIFAYGNKNIMKYCVYKKT